MIIYVSKDGNVKVDVNIENEDIWMVRLCRSNKLVSGNLTQKVVPATSSSESWTINGNIYG